MISKGGKVLAAECLRGRVLVFSNNWVILFFCYVIVSFGISPYTLKLYCETLKSINYNRTIFLLFFFLERFSVNSQVVPFKLSEHVKLWIVHVKWHKNCSRKDVPGVKELLLSMNKCLKKLTVEVSEISQNKVQEILVISNGFGMRRKPKNIEGESLHPRESSGGGDRS